MSEFDEALGEINKITNKIQQEKNDKLAEDAIESARFRAVGQRSAAQAFFTSLALSLHPVKARGLGTMATDGKRIMYDPEFTIGLSPDECHGVTIGHEPAHNAFMHFDRFRPLIAAGYEMPLLNVAGDLEINEAIVEAGFKLPESACMPGSREFQDCQKGLTMEEYAVILNKRPKNKQPGNRPGDGNDPGGCGGVQPAQDQSAAEQQRAIWQGRVASAAQQAKMRGELPSALERLIEGVIKPKVDPWEVLRDYMTRAAKLEVSWSRPNRRMLAQGIYLPRKTGVELGNVVVTIDCSGSISDDNLRQMAGFLEGVLTANPGTLWVFYHDTELHGEPQIWNPGDGPLVLTRRCCGGTSHRWLPNVLDNYDTQPAVVLCMTDMATDFPDDIGVPTIWVDVDKSDTRAPFGQYVCIA